MGQLGAHHPQNGTAGGLTETVLPYGQSYPAASLPASSTWSFGPVTSASDDQRQRDAGAGRTHGVL